VSRNVRSTVIWTGVALIGAVAWGVIALARDEQISAAWLVAAALGSYAIAYRFYSRFIARKVLEVDDRRATPAERLDNGVDYQPTDRRVLFGHHFAAIAGAGPLVGPVLAAQMGYLPGRSGSSSASSSPGRCRTWSSCSSPCAATASRWGRWPARRSGRSAASRPWLAVFSIMIILLAVLAWWWSTRSPSRRGARSRSR
jgi:carbon starvation protein